jgi:hypothetical protein
MPLVSELELEDELGLEFRMPLRVLRCAGPSRYTIGSFPRYQNTFRSLPLAEKQKLGVIANLIRRSFQTGCRPLLAVRLVGHADRDLQRGPEFEHRISLERALALRQELGRRLPPAISSRIAWDTAGAGAARLVVERPRAEPERARNRRVEVSLSYDRPEPNDPPYIRWVQSCLNSILGARLAITGLLDSKTRGAVRSFQQRRSLTPSGFLNAATLASLITTCGFPQILTTWGWPDAPTSGAATREPRIHAPSTGWNGATVGVGRVDRIPIDGLSTANPDEDRLTAAAESAKQRAVVLKPYYLNQANTTIDVLLHLHGHNVGYRQRKTRDGHQCLVVGSVRDIECDRMAQQFEVWGFSGGRSLRIRGERLIAVLAQGTSGSSFGTGAEGVFLDPKAYLTDIFGKLKSELPEGAQPGRIILSGHSGAGRPLSKMLESGNAPSSVAMVILFDAINGYPKDPTQLLRFKSWVEAQIANDIRSTAGKSEADQLNYLAHSMRFRGYHSNEGYYDLPYVKLADAINKALAPSATATLASQRVIDALTDNYKVFKVGGDHDGIVGNPTALFRGARPLEVALAKFPEP